MFLPGTAPKTNPVPHSSPDHRTDSVPLTLSSSPGSSTSSLSDLEQAPPAKRRRTTSSSSLSEADGNADQDEDNDEDAQHDQDDEEDDMFFKESVSSPSQSITTHSRSRTASRKPGKARTAGTIHSSSSSSSSDEEGGQPLASRFSNGHGRGTAGKRSNKAPGHGHAGKKSKKAHHTVAGTAPAHFGPGESGERIKTNGRSNATTSAHVNSEVPTRRAEWREDGQWNC